jgi:hypothetical protein
MITYFIQLRGQVGLDDLNPTSPIIMKPVGMEPTKTSLMIFTDQSGMIGLLRHLHGLGLIILSMRCKPEEENAENFD